MYASISMATFEAARLIKLKEETRNNINKIFMRNDGAVFSTNGHCAFAGRAIDYSVDSEGILIEPIGSPRVKYARAVFSGRNIKDGTILYVNEENSVVDISKCNYSYCNSNEYYDAPGLFKYIAISAYLGDEDVKLQAKYMSLASRIAKFYNYKFPTFNIAMNGDNNPVVISFESHDEKAQMIVMPVRK